jgi:isopropylmalate/homocitrate/citramalate synthase
MKYKIGKTLLAREGKSESEWLDLPLSFYRQANIRMHCDAIRYARNKGVRYVEFGGEDGSRGDVDYFIELFREGIKAGGTRPSWPDTVGVLTPEATRWYCSRIVAALPPDIPLLNHFHNDYGLATVNCITSLRFQGIHGYRKRLWRAGRQRAAASGAHGLARAVWR